MEAIKKQNQILQKVIENYLQEIEKQKQLNSQHQNQIETLLKFNERLLGIIENQLNNNRKQRASLQPISERSERQSDLNLAGGTMHSVIKPRKFGPISQRGSVTSNSLVERATFAGNKLQYFGKQLRSQLNQSSGDERSDYKKVSHSKLPRQSTTSIQFKNEVKNEMLNEIEELKKFRKQSSKFYDNKIVQIKNLSAKINKYHPLQQLNQINQKLNISPNTANLIKNMMNKA